MRATPIFIIPLLPWILPKKNRERHTDRHIGSKWINQRKYRSVRAYSRYRREPSLIPHMAHQKLPEPVYCVRRTLAAFLEPISRNTPCYVLAAVSGGIDSVVLLDALCSLPDDFGFRVCVAHVNHGLRPESDYEEQFVRSLAESHAVPFIVRRAPPWDRGENLEHWARRNRYRLLEEAREETQAEWVLTAHQQNDEAENFLLRALSGRMLSDAHGTAACDPARRLLRPFLKISRADICAYAAHFGLECVVDSSNNDTGRSRNRIRHELLPELERSYNPACLETLAALSRRFGNDEDFLWEKAQEAAALPVADVQAHFRQESPAIRWRLIALLAEKQLGTKARRLGYDDWQRVVELFLRGGTRSRALDLGFQLSCKISKNGKLSFFEAPEECSAVTGSLELPLGVPGDVRMLLRSNVLSSVRADVLQEAECQTMVEKLLNQPEAPRQTKYPEAYFDLELLGESKSHLRVRVRTDGDSMNVWKRGRRSLKKLFQERKLPLESRAQIPVIDSPSGILWVPGVARSNIAPVSSSTASVLRLSYIFPEGPISPQETVQLPVKGFT